MQTPNPRRSRWCAVIVLVVGLLVWNVLLDISSPAQRVSKLANQLRAGRKFDDRIQQAVWQKLPNHLRSKLGFLAPPDYWIMHLGAAQQLSALGPLASNAVPALLSAIGNEPPFHYEAFIEEFLALGRIGPGARQAVPELLIWLNDSSPQSAWRRGAAWALARIAPDDPQVATALVNALSRCKREDLFAFVNPDDFREPIVEGWHATRQAPFDPSEKRNLIRSLGKLRPQTPESLSALLNQLDHGEYAARATAADVLGTLRPIRAEVTRKLIEALAHTDSEHLPNDLERDAIATEWYAAFWRHRGSYAAVIQSMSDTTEKRARVFDLVEKDEFDPEAVLFVPAQGYSGWGLRLNLIRALGHIGPSASDALPMLLRECQNPTNILRFDAAAVAWRICGPTPEVLAVFEDGCRCPDKHMRHIVVSRLRELGTESPQAVALLSLALKDALIIVREQAAQTLAGLGTNAISALPALRELENDRAWIVRIAATQAVLAVQFSNTLDETLEGRQNTEPQK